MTDPAPDLPVFDSSAVCSAHVVISVRDVPANLAFFHDRLGFRVDAVYPADHPRHVHLSGHGLALALHEADHDVSPTLRLTFHGATTPPVHEPLRAPNGSLIEFAAEDATLILPPNVPEFFVSRLDEKSNWGEGRAGMRYRDLIPNRQGGRFIASHIRITEDGVVPDYVHFHRVRFQLIYCVRGWARLVYEGQGEPFVMQAGDCVLQPPEIRHRVLESGGGLEVVEVTCPADHETLADHSLLLPTPTLEPNRRFAGQRFAFHQAGKARWEPWRMDGFESRNVGIDEATGGLAGAHVVRPRRQLKPEAQAHQGEFLFLFLLDGHMRLETAHYGIHYLRRDDAVVIPAGECHRLCESDTSLEFLEIRVGALPTTVCELDARA